MYLIQCLVVVSTFAMRACTDALLLKQHVYRFAGDLNIAFVESDSMMCGSQGEGVKSSGC